MKTFFSFYFIFALLLFSSLKAQTPQSIESIISSAKLDKGASPSIHAAQLTHYLEQHGFIATRVLINENEELIVDLGKISKVSTLGISSKNKEHVLSILNNLLNTTPNTKDLDRALSLINDMPSVKGTFTLEHISDGLYELSFIGTQTPWFGNVSIDNPPSKIGEEYRINLNQNFNSVFSGGDILRFQGMFLDGRDTPNQKSLLASYQLPLGTNGTYLEFGFGDFSTETEVHSRASSFSTGFGTIIVPGSVTNHDFDGQAYYITSGYPIKRSHDEALYLIGQVDYSVDETNDIGETKVLHGDIGFFYSMQYPSGKSVHLGAYTGVGHNDSYVEDESEDYWSTYFMGAYITPLSYIDKFTEMRLEALLKIADKHLANSKLFSLGDEDFMRGYKSSTAIGSSGFMGTLEVAHAFYINNYVRRIAPYAFLDVGFVDNPSSKANNTNRPENHELASIGVGSHFSFSNNLTLNTYVGVPLANDVEGDLPSPSAYLKLTWSW